MRLPVVKNAQGYLDILLTYKKMNLVYCCIFIGKHNREITGYHLKPLDYRLKSKMFSLLVNTCQHHPGMVRKPELLVYSNLPNTYNTAFLGVIDAYNYPDCDIWPCSWPLIAKITSEIDYSCQSYLSGKSGATHKLQPRPLTRTALKWTVLKQMS